MPERQFSARRQKPLLAGKADSQPVFRLLSDGGQEIGILHNAARFIALSGRHAELLKTTGIPEEKTSILPLFVETHLLPYVPAPEGGDILFVGRLTPEKGLMPFCRHGNALIRNGASSLPATVPSARSWKTGLRNITRAISSLKGLFHWKNRSSSGTRHPLPSPRPPGRKREHNHSGIPGAGRPVIAFAKGPPATIWQILSTDGS